MLVVELRPSQRVRIRSWMRIDRGHSRKPDSLGVLTKNVKVKFKRQGLDERQEKDASGKVHWVRVQRKE